MGKEEGGYRSELSAQITSQAKRIQGSLGMHGGITHIDMDPTSCMALVVTIAIWVWWHLGLRKSAITNFSKIEIENI